jgi:hypothetical protein
VAAAAVPLLAPLALPPPAGASSRRGWLQSCMEVGQ